MGQRTAPGSGGWLRTFVAAVGVGALLISFNQSAPLADANPSDVGPVLHWNAVLGDAAIAACLAPTANPLAEARLYAMTHIAIHDALNAIDPRFASYSADLFAPPRASVDAAVAAASRTVIMSVFSELRDSVTAPCGARGAAFVEREYVTAVAHIPAGAAREEGLAIGRRAGVAVIENRRGDQAADPLGHPGLPHGLARPFGSTPATTTPYATARAELSWLQSATASWNRLARTTSIRRHLDLWQQARFLALLNIALADGYSSFLAWDSSTPEAQGPWNGMSSGHSASTPLMRPLNAPVYSTAGRLLP
jgi:hypothetical protein